MYDHWISLRCSNQLSYQVMSSTSTESQPCTAILIYCFVQCSNFVLAIVFFIHSFLFKFFKGNHISVAEWADIYGILYWRIFRASNRKLSCMGLEATITKLCLDALTNWAIRPEFQIALRTNFVQLVQSFIFCSIFSFPCVCCLGDSPRLFKWKFWTSIQTF